MVWDCRAKSSAYPAVGAGILIWRRPGIGPTYVLVSGVLARETLGQAGLLELDAQTIALATQLVENEVRSIMINVT